MDNNRLNDSSLRVNLVDLQNGLAEYAGNYQKLRSMKVSMPLTALALTMLALGAESVMQSGEGTETLTEASRIDAKLELSFLQLQADAVSRKLSAEDLRDEMAVWHQQNAALIKELRDLRDLAPSAPPATHPGSIPDAAGSDAEEFLADAGEYKRRLVDFIAGNLERPGDAEELRMKVSARMGKPDIVELDREVNQTHRELAENQPLPDDLPRTGDDLAGLTPAEVAEEEIYAAIYAATRRPLEEGEELRDRIAPLDQWIRNKRKPHQEEAALHVRQELNERIQSLQSRLDAPAEQIDQ